MVKTAILSQEVYISWKARRLGRSKDRYWHGVLEWSIPASSIWELLVIHLVGRIIAVLATRYETRDVA